MFVHLQMTIGMIRIDGPIWMIPKRRARKVKRPAAGIPATTKPIPASRD